jgi:hypothetical protein
VSGDVCIILSIVSENFAVSEEMSNYKSKSRDLSRLVSIPYILYFSNFAVFELLLCLSPCYISSVDILTTSIGFPEECCTPQRWNPSGPDPMLDMVIALMCMGLYPNVCLHQGKRKVTSRI